MMLVVKNLPTFLRNVREEGLTPGSGRSPGGGHSNPLQFSCLENPMDRGAGWATVQRVAKSWTQIKWLNVHTGSINLHVTYFWFNNAFSFIFTPSIQILSITSESSWTLFVPKSELCNSGGFFLPSQEKKDGGINWEIGNTTYFYCENKIYHLLIHLR